MQVFVSYSRRDEAAVGELIGDLERAHLSVWQDRELRGGDPWWQDILRRIRECEVFLLAVSENSLASKPCQAELAYARALGLPMLPVLIGSVGNLRTTPVADLQVLDYRERTLASGLALIGTLQALARDRRPLPDPLPEPPGVPFAYLFRLGSAIAGAQLTPNEQGDFIRQLRECLETEEDESVKEDARELLRALRRRPDVTYRNVQHIDELLTQLASSEHSAAQPDASAPLRSPSSPDSANTIPQDKAVSGRPRRQSAARWAADPQYFRSSHESLHPGSELSRAGSTGAQPARVILERRNWSTRSVMIFVRGKQHLVDFRTRQMGGIPFQLMVESGPDQS
ncbi:toll/interleukin-1 receptor domain-containing protein [Geodermatophilus sp. SYSU D01176]